MKNVLIVEHNDKSLKVNENNKNSGKFLLSGEFTTFDVENRNKRFYTAKNFVPAVNRLLEKKKQLSVVYGEFDHPDVFDISGKSVSHAIEDLKYNETNNCIDGQIALLSTHWGREAKAIINDGYPLFVSSRAAGTTDNNNNVNIHELFTYDVVLDPGFATSRVKPMNESFGFPETETLYRIYEMNDNSVNKLYNDNKADGKTKMDLQYMETFLNDKVKLIEHKILQSMNSASNEEIKKLSEAYENAQSELSKVKLYLNDFKTKFNILVKENSRLKKEVNETATFTNESLTEVKDSNKSVEKIAERLDLVEKFAQYIAKQTSNNKKDIKITEFKNNIIKNKTKNISEKLNKINEEIEVTQSFAENIAKETDITQKFIDSIIKEEIEVTQSFIENVAEETQATQKFTEAFVKEYNENMSEYKVDSKYLDYVADKVSGLIEYNEKLVTALNINESIEPIDNFLGLDKEHEIINNISESNDIDAKAELDKLAELDAKKDDAKEDDAKEDDINEGIDVKAELDKLAELDAKEDDINEGIDVKAELDKLAELDAKEDDTKEGDAKEGDAKEDEEPANESNVLIGDLVKFGDDKTGTVKEIKESSIVVADLDDNMVTLKNGEYEVLINKSANINETVKNVLEEFKKQKAELDTTPHFYSFLTTEQINDFEALNKDIQTRVKMKLENAEYFTSNDVLNVIKEEIELGNSSYEERLLQNIPLELKEAYNNLDMETKIELIKESKYFRLPSVDDIVNFWKTRPFAKTVIDKDTKLIKESLSADENEEFSEEFVDAFLKKMKL